MASLSVDDVLRKYMPSTKEEAERRAEDETQPRSRLPASHGRLHQWGKREGNDSSDGEIQSLTASACSPDVLHALQWRPLRVGAAADVAAAENQPDR